MARAPSLLDTINNASIFNTSIFTIHLPLFSKTPAFSTASVHRFQHSSFALPWCVWEDRHREAIERQRGVPPPTPPSWFVWSAWEDGHREALERQWGRAAPTPPAWFAWEDTATHSDDSGGVPPPHPRLGLPGMTTP